MKIKFKYLFKTGVFAIAQLAIAGFAMTDTPEFFACQKGVNCFLADVTYAEDIYANEINAYDKIVENDNIIKDDISDKNENTEGEVDSEDIDIRVVRSRNISFYNVKINNDIDNITFTGKPLEPEIEVYSENGTVLRKDIDYEVNYIDNVYVNDYFDEYCPRVVIKGIGEYQGELVENFRINPVEVNDDNILVTGITDCVYDKNVHTMQCNIKVNNKNVYEENDYTIEYKDNIFAGTAQMEIVFLGNYEGKVTRYFNIKPANIEVKGYRCIDANTASISWEEQKGVDGYLVYKMDDTGKYVCIEDIKGCGTTSCVINGNKINQNVKLKLYAYKKKNDGTKMYSPVSYYSLVQGIPVTKISATYITGSSIKLAVGQKRNIYISITPYNATNKSVTWSSSNKAVASVDNYGNVKGVGEGNAIITATANDGTGKAYILNVKITKRASSFSYKESSLNIVATDHAKYSYNEMVNDISQLKSKYGEYLSVVSLGKSYDNRNIYEITLGNKNAARHMVVVGATHAREYMNSMLVMKQIELYCKYYYTGMYDGKYFSEILENVCIHFVPMLNPDGVTLSQQGAAGIRNTTLRSRLNNMYENYGSGVSKTVYFSRWKANARGVDLNRNYYFPKSSYLFGKGHPAADGYCGYAPNSEKETKYLVKLVNNVKPRATISYHSTGSQIYWKYGQTGVQLTNSKILFNITQSLNRYQAIEKVSVGTGFSNWVSTVKGIPAMTVETGTTVCPLEISEWSGVWSRNKYVTLAQAKAVWMYKM